MTGTWRLEYSGPDLKIANMHLYWPYSEPEFAEAVRRFREEGGELGYSVHVKVALTASESGRRPQ